MRSSVGYFCPAWNAPGLTITPCTSVPSLLFAVNSSVVQLGTTEEFTAKSKDGTEVHGVIVKPGAFQAGQKYPTLLRIHGGPNGQDEHAFSFERELFAANGYVVVAANYRGSNGRGSAYQKAIFA